MTKRMWALIATLAVAAAFPAAGATKASGGTLNMVAWEGYLQPQWVKPFEQQSGCTIHPKYAGSSDEMVTLMRSGRTEKRRPFRSRMFVVPTNPATNSVVGCS